jgi:hypothetical protein
MKNHETHIEYILDILEEEQVRLTEKILSGIPPELEPHFNRLVEVIIEIGNLNNQIVN